MFDWLFGRNKSSFESTPKDGNALLLADFGTINYTIYTSEIDIAEKDLPDIYVRDGRRGAILDAISRIPEVQTAVAFWTDAVASGEDGDDRGVRVAEYIDKRDTIKVDPQIEDLVNEIVDALFPAEVIQSIAERIITRGDEFRYVSIEKGRISDLIYLPCWQVFRREYNGKLEGFYLKKHANDQNAIRYDPKYCFHWRFKPLMKYGRSLFENSKDDAITLLKRLADLDIATRSSAIDPLVHEMPNCATQDYLAIYRKAHQEKKKNEVIGDFYLNNGAKVYRASGGNTPNLNSLQDSLNFTRMRLVMPSQVPFFLLGLNTEGAKDIAGQPALAFARSISSLRSSLSKEMRRVIDLDLTLKGIPPDKHKYRLVWPDILVNPYEQQMMIKEDVEEESEDGSI